jgi:hypothetical protein
MSIIDNQVHPSSSSPPSSKHARAPALNGINLSLGPGQLLRKLRRQLRLGEKHALPWLDRAQRSTALLAYAGDVERAVLLRLLSVLGEGVGQTVGWRGGVGFGRVVDFCLGLDRLVRVDPGQWRWVGYWIRTCWCCPFAEELDHGLALL